MLLIDRWTYAGAIRPRQHCVSQQPKLSTLHIASLCHNTNPIHVDGLHVQEECFVEECLGSELLFSAKVPSCYKEHCNACARLGLL